MDLLTLERHTQVAYVVTASSLAFVSLVPGLLPAWAVMTLLAAATLGTGVLHGTARAVEGLFMDMVGGRRPHTCPRACVRLCAMLIV